MLIGTQSLEELVDAGRLNGTNFCIMCMVGASPEVRLFDLISHRRKSLCDRSIVEHVVGVLLASISESSVMGVFPATVDERRQSLSMDLELWRAGSGLLISALTCAVGFRNHRYFLFFVLFLIAGILLFDHLCIACTFDMLGDGFG